jgi:MerR family glutamine synthetase transcriptional repressor
VKGELVPMRIVVERTGLTPRQIRYYEQQGLVVPERSPGGQRLYRPEQVELLRQIRVWLAEGESLATVRERLRAPARQEPRRWPERSARLTSLYPVSDRAELERYLEEHLEEEEKP